MRIFKAFLVVMGSVILFLLPSTGAMYDFKTDLQTDTFSSITGVGETSDNLTLSEDIYEDDTTTIDLSASLSSDNPAWNAYDTTTHSLNVIGLTANTTRTLTIAYDIDALEGSDAIVALADKMAWIWLLMIIAFPIAGIASILMGRA